jgi:hypothetical protein
VGSPLDDNLLQQAARLRVVSAMVEGRASEQGPDLEEVLLEILSPNLPQRHWSRARGILHIATEVESRDLRHDRGVRSLRGSPTDLADPQAEAWAEPVEEALFPRPGGAREVGQLAAQGLSNLLHPLTNLPRGMEHGVAGGSVPLEEGPLPPTAQRD